MNAVWKFPLPTMGTTLDMPKDAHVIACQLQDGMPTLWAIVDPSPNCPTERRRFVLAATGEPFDHLYPDNHIGTVQDDRGLVFHCFETAP